MGDKVTVVSPEGNSTDVDPGQVQTYLDRNWHVQGAGERAEGVATEERQSEITPLDTGIVRGLSGATLGASDAAFRAIGGQGAARTLRDVSEAHSTVGTVADLAGGLALGGAVGKVGGAVSGLAGGGILGGIAGTAAEGAIYGTGTGVSQLALSDDPLTAEHIMSTLGTNALTGAAIGGGIGAATSLGGKVLSRAQRMLEEAGSARSAIEGLPEDLQGLDDAGLKDAYKSAEEAHKGDIAAERKSLESLRQEQRNELVNQVRDFHNELATEKPIYQAVIGEDVQKAVPGLATEVETPLAKSFNSLRSKFDNPIELQKNPWKLLDPLRQQQTALENLQSRLPEVQMALGGDARAAALDHIDYALEQNKAFQQAIEAVDSKANPVMSGRLAKLTGGPSERMEAITAGREALKNAPEMGLLQKGAKAGAFAGVTALAHMVPGMGLAAPFVGKAASDAVGKLFTHLGAGVRAASERSSAALKSFLTVSSKMEAPVVAGAAKTLSSVRFAPTVEKEESGDSLLASYQKRADELRSQTTYAVDGEAVMRPEARMALAKHLAPIAAVSPTLADKVETAQARKVSYLSAALPKHPEVGGMQIGPDNWHPSEIEMRSFARKVRAAEDPHSVEERLAAGVCTPEEAEAYRTVYPEKFAAMQEAIATAAPQLSKTLPIKKKVALYVFTGVPTMPALQPNVFKQLQSNFTSEPGSMNGVAAPKPAPHFGPLGSAKDLDKPTRAQQRAD